MQGWLYTSSDVLLQHLYNRDPAIPNQLSLFMRHVDLCIQRLQAKKVQGPM